MSGEISNSDPTVRNGLLDLPPEIFLMTMDHLDYEDLRTMRMVSKLGRNTIDGSRKHRQQLFFEPDPDAGGRAVYVWRGGFDRHGLVSAMPTGQFTPPADGRPSDNPQPTDELARPIVVPHPWLRASIGKFPHRVWAHMSFPWDLEEMLAWHEDGDWKDQFITQPPSQQVTVLAIDIMLNDMHGFQPNPKPSSDRCKWGKVQQCRGSTQSHGVLPEEDQSLVCEGKSQIRLRSSQEAESEEQYYASIKRVKEAEDIEQHEADGGTS